MGKSKLQIQGTNDYCTLSKSSMVQQGYFKDDYISQFITHQCRRAPLINLGYYVRAVVIDAVLQRFVQNTKGAGAQIISCGAGFDSTYFRLSSNKILTPNIIYYEVDYPTVIKRKVESIQHSQLLFGVTGCLREKSGIHFADNFLRLVPGDLRELQRLELALKHAGVQFLLPTLLLAECSITYMDETSASELIKWAAMKFENATFVTYEQVYPNDGFGIVMQRHFESIGCPLLSLLSYPDLHAQEERYTSKGWTSCHARSLFDIFMNVTSSEERQRALTLEPFDEFEEWHLKCCHYTLTIASNGNLTNWAHCLMNVTNIDKVFSKKQLRWTLDTNKRESDKKLEIARFSHKTVYFLRSCTENCILVIGGFGNGSSMKGHKRLSEVCLLNIAYQLHSPPVRFDTVSQSETIVCSVNNIDLPKVFLDCLHHTCTLLPLETMDNSVRIILFGGRSSPMTAVNGECVLLNMPLDLKEKTPSLKATVIPTTGDHKDMPVSRWRHTAVFLKPFAEKAGYVVVFGGRTAQLQVLGDLWLFILSGDQNTITYKRVPATNKSWPQPRFSHSAAAVFENKSMIVTGGIGGADFLPFSDVWLFDSTTMGWQEVLLEGPTMLPRYGHTSVVYKDLLILFGGVNTTASHQPGICVINLKTRMCLEYSLPTQDLQHPVLLVNHSSEQIGDGSVVTIVGGGGNCFSFGTTFNKYLITIDLMQFL